VVSRKKRKRYRNSESDRYNPRKRSREGFFRLEGVADLAGAEGVILIRLESRSSQLKKKVIARAARRTTDDLRRRAHPALLACHQALRSGHAMAIAGPSAKRSLARPGPVPHLARPIAWIAPGRSVGCTERRDRFCSSAWLVLR
jgi:hypothetical protein